MEQGKDFKMTIEDTFFLIGRGVVCTGTIEDGQVALYDKLFLKRKDNSIREVEVTGIELSRRLVEQAKIGDCVGILIRGIQSKSDVCNGDILISKNDNADEGLNKITNDNACCEEGAWNTMKKLIINSNCIACGACFALSNLLEEDAEGKAVVVGKGYINDIPLRKIKELLAICPVKAIEVVEDNSVTKANIEKKIDALKSYSAPQPRSSECPFRKDDYHIDLPFANGEYRYDYSSYSRAERAGLEEFDRQMYSQIEKIARKIFTEYRVQHLRQYYEYEANEKNYYYRIEMAVNKMLNDVACDIEALTGKKVPETLKYLEVKPNTSDEYYAYGLKHFEDGWVVSGTVKQFKESPYRLDDYASYIDSDDMDTYETGLFGRSKEVTKYCYRNMREAFEELRKDIRNACYYAYDFDEIDFSEMKSYTEKVNKEVQDKASKLLALCK